MAKPCIKYDAYVVLGVNIDFKGIVGIHKEARTFKLIFLSSDNQSSVADLCLQNLHRDRHSANINELCIKCYPGKSIKQQINTNNVMCRETKKHHRQAKQQQTRTKPANVAKLEAVWSSVTHMVLGIYVQRRLSRQKQFNDR